MSGNGKKSPKFPELPPKYSVSREWRNKAEKLRRNRLNGYLSDVKSLTPIVADKTKKSETTKTNVLRTAASYIRLNQMYPSSSHTDSSQEPVQKAVNHVEAMKGVVFLLSQTGRILFIGEKIEQYIGYNQLDLVGVSLLDYTHPGDKSKLNRNLERKLRQPPGSRKTIKHEGSVPGYSEASPGGGSGALVAMGGASPGGGGGALVAVGGASPGYQEASNGKDDEEEWTRKRSFYLRLKEKPQKQHPDRVKYEHMHILGHLRDATDSEKKLTKELEYVFVGMMKTVKDRPIFELNLMDAVQDQYITRHLPDGRIIFSDHRISSIAGYLPDDVRGHSAFNFMLGEDLPWTTLALRTLFASSTREGLVVYRLKTAFGGVITLQSRGYLEVNKDDQRIEQFVCINTLIRPEDSEKYLQEQQQRFKPMIANLQNYGINSLSKIPSISNSAISQIRKSSKRKLNSDLDLDNLPSKYQAIDPRLHPQAINITRNESGTCIRLASSSTTINQYMPDILVPSRTNMQLAAVAEGSSINSSEQIQGSNTASATDANTSSELVSLLQELGPDEIVNMLRQKGIKVQANKPVFSHDDRTINQLNESQNMNVEATSSQGGVGSYGSYGSRGAASKQKIDQGAVRAEEGATNNPKDDYNVDSIASSLLDFIGDDDLAAALAIRQQPTTQQQGVLHRERDGAPFTSQFGGVLRTKNQLYFGEKEDVNKNISEIQDCSEIDASSLKSLPGTIPGVQSRGQSRGQSGGQSRGQPGGQWSANTIGGSSGERERLGEGVERWGEARAPPTQRIEATPTNIHVSSVKDPSLMCSLGLTTATQSTPPAFSYSNETTTQQQQPHFMNQQQFMENIDFTDGSQQLLVTAQSSNSQSTAGYLNQLSQQQSSHGMNQFQQQQLTQAGNQPVAYAVQQRSAVIQSTASLSQLQQPMETDMFEMPDLSSLVSDGSSEG